MDVGVEFSHYRVIEHIGRGGMADVWSARDKRLNRTVAIKTVARDLSQDMNPVKLFEREARTIAALEHPHILPIYEFGDYSGQLFIVMRYVSGGSLEDLLEEGPLPVEDALRLARSVALALDYAHSNKVIHLDLKPSNILLDSYHLPYLADFGLATVLGPEGRAANPGSGTLLYMAPEQLTAEDLDHRADIYSFSILIFHMMTGQLPFDATIPLALKQLQLNETLPGVEELHPGLPSSVNAILRSGTEVDAKRRPASLGDIVMALENVLMPARVAVSGASGGAARERSSIRSTQDMDTKTDALEELITGSIDDLITRTAPQVEPQALDDLITGPLDGLITGPADRVAPPSPPEDNKTARLDIDLDNLITSPEVTPEEMARREAIDIYTRARRAWAHGQGRFLLGITHFMLINDYYVNAEANKLELDEAGMQLLLRGAIEYDHDIDTWWTRLDDEARRWVALHALRSENAPARVRALERLEDLPDGENLQIPKLVAQTLQAETNKAAKLAAIRVLDVRARTQPNLPQIDPNAPLRDRLSSQLQLKTPSVWRETVYSQDIDLLLAQLALGDSDEDVREAAARAIWRIHSTAAVREIAERQRKGERGALRALALVRDEAPTLPPVVSSQARLYAWLANTLRRVTDDPMQAVWRFIIAALAGALAFGGYAYAQLPAQAFFFAERIGMSISTGATVGIFVGLVVLLASEIPMRLRGFWPWWGRLLLSAIMGVLTGALMWVIFTWFFLYFEPDTWQNFLIGGLGAAAAFALSAVLRIPAWIAAIWAAIMLWLPMYLAWFYNQPLLYVRPADPVRGTPAQDINTFAVPIALVIALGAFAPLLIAEVRALVKRTRTPSA